MALNATKEVFVELAAGERVHRVDVDHIWLQRVKQIQKRHAVLVRVTNTSATDTQRAT